jgi:hypothetical protein
LDDAGIRLRAGQVVMVTGRPKAGKSNLVQYVCTFLSQEHGVPVLYYSLDMDAFTAAVRQAAIVTGHKQENISREIEGPGEAFYEDALHDVDIEFCFDTEPELPEIQQELDAYVEKWDRWPGVVVIDNLLNINCGEGTHADYKFVMKNLQALARRTGALVLVLHHAREGVKDVTRPPTAAETDNKINQIPELILSVAHDDDTGEMQIAALMVRNGAKSDPNAERPYRTWADFSTMQFTRNRPQRQWNWEQDFD